MGLPVFETPPETTNGSNKVFTTSADYKKKSVRVWRNGMLNRKEDIDGWIELGNRKVEMKEPPEATDVIQIYYEKLGT